LFCGLTLRYRKTIHYKAAAACGVMLNQQLDKRGNMKKTIMLVVISISMFSANVFAYTGSIKFREQGGQDTYQIFVQNGKIVSGWAGNEGNPRYAILGGWYDGSKMVILMQQNGSDISNEYYSYAFHLKRTDNKLWFEYGLYGFKKTKTSKNVPFVIIDESRG
jgi:hypothetical protein